MRTWTLEIGRVPFHSMLKLVPTCPLYKPDLIFALFNADCMERQHKMNNRILEDFYIKQNLIGRGGFGQVYNGFGIIGGEKVAIKEIFKTKTIHRHPQTNIPTEISHLLQLQNISGVIKLIDWFETDEVVYIVMEHFGDQDLFDYVADNKQMNEPQAKHVFRQLVETVIQCKDKKILHRDIKDENILYDSRNQSIKLIDFGSSTEYHHGFYTDFEGTLFYAPPEWLEHRQYTANSIEAWSLGTILYTLVTGNISYKTPATLFKDDELRWPKQNKVTKLRLELSHNVKDLTEKCLALNPDERIKIEDILKHPWFMI